MRSRSAPIAWLIVLAIALIVAETRVVYQSRWVAPEVPLGVVCMAGVHVVSCVWWRGREGRAVALER
jgi:hypothetical protein